METDLDLSSSDYEWLLTVFYIAYIVFQPLGIMYTVIPPHMWGAFCVLGWGITGTLQSATYSWAALMAARFFLGLFEAAFATGVTFYLCFFYRRNEVGFRAGLYIGAAALATCFAGVLAYGITSGDPQGIASWRLLFLVEGLPGIVAAVVVFFFLPDCAEKCRFLNAEEKAIARSRSLRQVGREVGGRSTGIKWTEIREALCDPKVSHPTDYISILLICTVLDHVSNVLFMQCFLRISPCLPAYYPPSDGLHPCECSRAVGTAIFSRIPHGHYYMLACR